MKSLIIPQSVEYIGDYSFSRCSSIESIGFPSKINSINDHLLSECSSKVVISPLFSLAIIKAFVFYEGSFISSIIILLRVTFIEQASFSKCSSLISIYIPSSIASINSN